jgi:hypothetical protein
MPNVETNANGSWTPVTSGATDSTHWGWRCNDADNTDYTFRMVVPIPATINATPAGEIKVRWVTASTDVSNNLRMTVDITDMARAGSGEDWSPTAYAESLTTTQVSSGQRDDNIMSFTIATSAETVDKVLIGILGRAGQHASDTLAADVWILEAWYQADIT